MDSGDSSLTFVNYDKSPPPRWIYTPFKNRIELIVYAIRRYISGRTKTSTFYVIV